MDNQKSNRVQFQFTLVSLSMIILSLFVFLNAFTKFEPKKQQSALSSIHTHFPKTFSELLRGEVEVSGTSLEIPPVILALLPNPTAERTKILDDDGEIYRGNAFIHVSIRLDKLFDSGDDQLLPTHLEFLQKLTEQVKALGYEVEVQIRFVPPTAASEDAAWDLALLRFSSVVRFLIDSGMPAVRISGGAHPGQAAEENDQLALTFRKQSIENRLEEKAFFEQQTK